MFTLTLIKTSSTSIYNAKHIRNTTCTIGKHFFKNLYYQKLDILFHQRFPGLYIIYLFRVCPGHPANCP